MPAEGTGAQGPAAPQPARCWPAGGGTPAFPRPRPQRSPHGAAEGSGTSYRRVLTSIAGSATAALPSRPPAARAAAGHAGSAPDRGLLPCPARGSLYTEGGQVLGRFKAHGEQSTNNSNVTVTDGAERNPASASPVRHSAFGLKQHASGNFTEAETLCYYIWIHPFSCLKMTAFLHVQLQGLQRKTFFLLCHLYCGCHTGARLPAGSKNMMMITTRP